jgi:hypothetical protein
MTDRIDLERRTMDFDDLGWQDMAIAGALAEEMTEAERERMRLEREAENQDPLDEDEDLPDDIDIEKLIP